MKVNLNVVNCDYVDNTNEDHERLVKAGFKRQSSNCYYKNNLLCIIKSNHYVIKDLVDKDNSLNNTKITTLELLLNLKKG